MKHQLQWSYRRATTTCGKLPLDWEDQGRMMALIVAYLVKAYDIPLALVVNTYQMPFPDLFQMLTILCILLIFLIVCYEFILSMLCRYSSCTNGQRKDLGEKGINVIGMEDKCQVTTCVSSAVNGTLLPMQAIFIGKTMRSLPMTHLAKLYLSVGF